MNKKITKLLSVFVIAGALGVGAAFGMSGCKKGGHTHTKSGDWESDETYHWHDCTANDGQEYDKGTHVYDDDSDADCNACGYVRGDVHTHTKNDAAWLNDATHHWHDCVANDGQEYDKGEHAYDDAYDADCNTCGYVRTVPAKPAVTITGGTTVREGATLQLTASVANVPTGEDTGVTWSVDKPELADITQDGLLTAKATGTVVVTATSKFAGSTKTHTVTITEKALYDKLCEKDGVDGHTALIKEDYSTTATVSDTAPAEGTAGIWFSLEDTANPPTATATNNNVTVANGVAKLNDDGTSSGATIYIAEFGNVDGSIEGCADIQLVGGGSSWTFIRFCDATGAEKVGIRWDSTSGFCIRENGDNTTLEAIPNAPTPSATSALQLHYLIKDGNISISLNSSEYQIVDHAIPDGATITNLRFYSSNSKAKTMSVDNICVLNKALTVAEYKELVNQRATDYATEVGITEKAWYTAESTGVKAVYDAAVQAAQDKAAVDLAFASLQESALSAARVEAKGAIETALATAFASGYQCPEAQAEIRALKEKLEAEVDNAELTITDVLALGTAETIQGKIDTAIANGEVHGDSYHLKPSVKVDVYAQGGTVSVLKEGAEIKDKATVVLNVQEDIVPNIAVPEGKFVKALYTDADCTEANKIGETYTLDANGANDPTYVVNVTIYAVYGDVVTVSIADSNGLILNNQTALSGNDGTNVTLEAIMGAIDTAKVPEGYFVKGIYADANLSEEITETYTLDASSATEQVVTVYVKYGVQVSLDVISDGVSVLKTDAVLKGNDGTAIQLADVISAIEVPQGKLLKGVYSDVGCTTAITGDITLNAGNATQPVTTNVYVLFVEAKATANVVEFSCNKDSGTGYVEGTPVTFGSVNGNAVITIIGKKWADGKDTGSDTTWNRGGYQIGGGTNDEATRLFQVDLSATGANLTADQEATITVTFSEKVGSIPWISTKYGNTVPTAGAEGLQVLGTASSGYGVRQLSATVKGGSVYYFCHNTSTLYVKGIKVEYSSVSPVAENLAVKTDLKTAVDTAINGLTANVYNKLTASTKFTVEEAKAIVPTLEYYVEVGTITATDNVASITLGGTTFTKGQKVAVSVGNNAFIEDIAYYVEGGKLYVAAPIIAFETKADSKIKLNDTEYNLNLDPVTATVDFTANYEVGAQSTITPVDGNANKYTLNIKDGTKWVEFTTEGVTAESVFLTKKGWLGGKLTYGLTAPDVARAEGATGHVLAFYPIGWVPAESYDQTAIHNTYDGATMVYEVYLVGVGTATVTFHYTADLA